MANIVHTMPYPVLEDGNLSYNDGKYKTDITPLNNGNSVQIKHHISGAPFLEKLLQQNKAQFACTIALPKTSYRKLHIADEGQQIVQWDKSFVAEPPLLRPLLLATEEIKHCFTEKDGVANVWHGQEVIVPKGARMACSTYFQPNASIIGMLHMIKDDRLAEGTFEVDSLSEYGFVFQVKLPPNFHRFVHFPDADQKELWHNIHVLFLTQCLRILQIRFNTSDDSDTENNWQQHINLRTLADMLEEKGILHWSDDDFKPELAATKLKNLFVPNIAQANEDNAEEE
ncbi:MAG: hypothetical protein K0U45_03445 [Alphaproteobacteria bacterium]|nr:hypothetical protein [Alphaproteobacteria bacterium]